MNSLTIDLGNRLENESIYKLFLKSGKNVVVKFFAKVFLFLLEHSTFLQEIIIKISIESLKELSSLLDEYSHNLRSKLHDDLVSDYRKITKVLPTYQFLKFFVNQKKKEFETIPEFIELINTIVDKLDSIEATLEIYQDASTREDLNDVYDDIKNNKKENFFEWHQIAK